VLNYIYTFGLKIKWWKTNFRNYYFSYWFYW